VPEGLQLVAEVLKLPGHLRGFGGTEELPEVRQEHLEFGDSHRATSLPLRPPAGRTGYATRSPGPAGQTLSRRPAPPSSGEWMSRRRGRGVSSGPCRAPASLPTDPVPRWSR